MCWRVGGAGLGAASSPRVLAAALGGPGGVCGPRAAGHASITAIMWCESLTMASVVGLWIWAWRRRHPMAGPMLVAIGASIAAAMLRLVPGAAALAGLDPNS